MEVALQGKGGEIPGAAKLLKLVDLSEKVVMGAALHAQRAVSIQIVEAGGDYIWFAKGNQSQLAEDIRLWFGPEPDPIAGQGRLPKDFEVVKETSKGHRRLEERTLTVSSQLNDFLDWPYGQQVFQLERCFVSTKIGALQEQVVMISPACPEKRLHLQTCSKRSVRIGALKMVCTTAEMSRYGKTALV